jgi:hypothetical protein
MNKLPKLGHPSCGGLSYSYPKRTKHGWYHWHCHFCGQTIFFENPEVFTCTHEVDWIDCKNNPKYETRYCYICKIRAFRPKKKED